MDTLLNLLPGKSPLEAAMGSSGQWSITASDGVKIAYERYGRLDDSRPVIVLIHGWSGSRHYFDLNARPLANAGCTVYSFDLRSHGDSGRPTWGHHVARLAADLRDLLTQLDLREVTVLGTSMGAAVIWSYLELFGEERLKQAVFVDQAPLQNVAPDWKWGSNGCFDIASLTRLQCKLEMDFPGFAKDNCTFCAALPLSKEVTAVLEAETLRADPKALALLMADHTAIDWRPLLPRITIPCLNLVGRLSAVFPWFGCETVGKLIPNAHTVFFEQANHWLYLEQPDAFNKLVADFVHQGLVNVRGVHSL